MNRKEIIELINYKGEYTKEVKKKLRELLKKYHPDHYKKEDNTFKLINEIKKELDSGKKISIDNKKIYEKEHHNDYKITEEILDLSRKRDNLIDKKNNYKKELSKLQSDYRVEYDNDVNYRNKAYDITNDIISLQSKRQVFNIMMIISILLSITFIFTKWYYLLIITLILFVFAIYNVIKIETTLGENLEVNSKTIKVSDNNLIKIRSINERMNDIYKKIWDLDCEINRLTTRINLLKSKIR